MAIWPLRDVALHQLNHAETFEDLRVLPTNRPPTHPGEMLLEEFLKPLGISQSDLAGRINVSYPRVNEIINGKRGISPDTALRLSKLFGTTAQFG